MTTKIVFQGTCEERTRKLLKHWEGKKLELNALSTIMCMDLIDQENSLEWRKVFNFISIAERVEFLLRKKYS